MKKIVLLMAGVLGGAVVLFAFLPSRKHGKSRLTDARFEDTCWFCYPDGN